MKYHKIDNSLNNLGKTVLWQYDRAVRLLSVLKHMQVLYHCAVEQFWEFWTTKVLSIDTCGALGCSIWGAFLGVSRPTIVENGGERLIATSVYRRLLKGAFYLMKANSSYEDILGYMEIVFGVGGADNFSKWGVYVSEYGWTTNVEELNRDTQEVEKYYPRLAYKKGIVFYYQTLDSNWKCLRDIKVAENTSFENLLESGAIQETIEPATKIGGDSTLLLKLYDPEGICRKIGGSPANSLSISVSYEFGDTTIIARATRRRKCGITLVDNGDMSMEYGKSEYYEEMHKDQKYLFEQKLDEFCPFPLGIRTNGPIPEWILGFKGQENEQYISGIGYGVGDVFGYADATGHCYNYICKQEIPAFENTGFNSIKGKLEITKEGDPFIGGLVEARTPIMNSSLDMWTFHKRYFNKLNGGVWADYAFLNLSSLIDISTLENLTFVRLSSNQLYSVKIGNLRYLVVSKLPTDNFFINEEGVMLYKNQLRFYNYMSENFYFTSPTILTNPFSPLIERGTGWGSGDLHEKRFYEIERKKYLSEEFERVLGILAQRYDWKIVRWSEAQKPLSGLQYDKTTVFKENGNDVYIDDVGNLQMLSKTTIASSSTLKSIKQTKEK